MSLLSASHPQEFGIAPCTILGAACRGFVSGKGRQKGEAEAEGEAEGGGRRGARRRLGRRHSLGLTHWPDPLAVRAAAVHYGRIYQRTRTFSSSKETAT